MPPSQNVHVSADTTGDSVITVVLGACVVDGEALGASDEPDATGASVTVDEMGFAVGNFVRPDAPGTDGEVLGESDSSDDVGDLVATVEAEGDPVGDSDVTGATGDSVSTDEAEGDPVGDSVVTGATGDSVVIVKVEGDPVGDSVVVAGDGEAVTAEVTGASVTMSTEAEGELVGDSDLSEATGDSVTTVEVEEDSGVGVLVASVGLGVRLEVGDEVPDGIS